MKAQCVICGEMIDTPYAKEATKTAEVGCQACRLAYTLEHCSVYAFTAIYGWMVDSGQEAVFDAALRRTKPTRRQA